MDLTLYKLAATGRINLTGLVSNREAYYSGQRDPDTGVVTLTPVRIVSANGRAAEGAPSPVQEESVADPEGTNPGDAPWDQPAV